MDLQQIREFVLSGSETHIVAAESCETRLRTKCDPIYNRLEHHYTDKCERENATSELALALAAYSEVYTEIGMKAGARLMHQLLVADNLLISPQK